MVSKWSQAVLLLLQLLHCCLILLEQLHTPLYFFQTHSIPFQFYLYFIHPLLAHQQINLIFSPENIFNWIFFFFLSEWSHLRKYFQTRLVKEKGKKIKTNKPLFSYRFGKQWPLESSMTLVSYSQIHLTLAVYKLYILPNLIIQN